MNRGLQLTWTGVQGSLVPSLSAPDFCRFTVLQATGSLLLGQKFGVGEVIRMSSKQ